jgi:hypothetical protein
VSVSSPLTGGQFELTLFTTNGDLLTKQISLSEVGTLLSDSSACRMPSGRAERVRFEGLDQFAEFIGSLAPNEAIALGQLREEIPDEVEITTKAQLAKLNGTARPDLIARTADQFGYVPGKPAPLLVDFDLKGMPLAVRERIDDAGGDLFGVLSSIFPEITQAGRVERVSTSAGLTRADTGERLTGSGGLHLYLLVEDGRDIPRALRSLHDRAWLAGYGWLMVGKAGQLLERSLVDRMVGGPERLVFEGQPELAFPLEQDPDLRRPRVFDGNALDTRALLDLTPAERSRKQDLWAAEAARLQPAAAKARNAFIEQQAARIIAARPECSREEAVRIVKAQIGGDLMPDVPLEFDDPEMAGSTVGDVLREPDRFVGATLADPLEGGAYGACKAKIMRREDGSLWINSFAHGRTVYELTADKPFIESELRACEPKDAPDRLVRLLLISRTTPSEENVLRDLCCILSGAKPLSLKQTIKATRIEQANQRAQEAFEQYEISSRDRRVRLTVPRHDAPRLPTMRTLDEVLGADKGTSRVMRSIEGKVVEIRHRSSDLLHELTSGAANGPADDDATPLPAPRMPLITEHDKISLNLKQETLIEWLTDEKPPEPVALPAVFLEHYIGHRESSLPAVASIVTAPLVLPDGRLLATYGLDEARGVYFEIDPALREFIPDPRDCSGMEAATALDYLANVFLCDVATNFEGKCVLIAMMLTIIERALLPQRPAFFVTAGRRGGGKTTALVMLVMALTGKAPPAAAWSNDKEERRKAVLAYLREGVQFVVWDNIERGSRISCPTIEKVLTSEVYSDRVLCETTTIAVASTIVMGFTGNNIAPKGDLASRSLNARIDVDRPDPENRQFEHPDPIEWTLDHRGDILNACYTLLLAHWNEPYAGQPKTRMKPWWQLVGRAVEYAAEGLMTLEEIQQRKRTATKIDFGEIFASVEDDDEEAVGIVNILEILQEEWPNAVKFKAVDVLKLIGDIPFLEKGSRLDRALAIQSYFKPDTPSGSLNAISLGMRLNNVADDPVFASDDFVLKLIRTPGKKKRDAALYHVRRDARNNSSPTED